MKKLLFIPFLFLIISCNNNSPTTETEVHDTVLQKKTDTLKLPPVADSNQAFKEVKAENIGEHKFKITGKARVFEAAFSWYIEDGHNVLKEGHETANGGAPEWGTFSFTVDAIKDMENSTLHIILYEASAKDGSAQHQLAVKLY